MRKLFYEDINLTTFTASVVSCEPAEKGKGYRILLDATAFFQKNGILFAPGKASNAGGVATSGLEMSQNAIRLNWHSAEVDSRLQSIMINIHDAARRAATEFGEPDNYVMGANIAGFRKVADAMIDLGI